MNNVLTFDTREKERGIPDRYKGKGINTKKNGEHNNYK